jgi:hypothetical protein
MYYAIQASSRKEAYSKLDDYDTGKTYYLKTKGKVPAPVEWAWGELDEHLEIDVKYHLMNPSRNGEELEDIALFKFDLGGLKEVLPEEWSNKPLSWVDESDADEVNIMDFVEMLNGEEEPSQPDKPDLSPGDVAVIRPIKESNTRPPSLRIVEKVTEKTIVAHPLDATGDLDDVLENPEQYRESGYRTNHYRTNHRGEWTSHGWEIVEPTEELLDELRSERLARVKV